jgi:DNA-directed RNA polymerase specialized sigma24 family protein
MDDGWSEAWEREYPNIFNFAKRLAGEDEAQDIVGDAMLRFVAKSQTDDRYNPETFRRLSMRTVRNLVVDRVRSWEARPGALPLLVEPEASTGGCPAQAVEEKDLFDAVRRLATTRNDIDRKLLAVLLSGEPHKPAMVAIAEEYELTYNGVKARYHRMIAALRVSLREAGYALEMPARNDSQKWRAR